MGPSLTLPIAQGRFALGTWQGIYLNEHRCGLPCVLKQTADKLVIMLFGLMCVCRLSPAMQVLFLGDGGGHIF
jgi:hypothetical protein